MKDDEKLHLQLNRPRVPENLEDRIRANWQAQMLPTKNAWPAKRLLAVAAAFTLALGVVLVNYYPATPALVNAALRDIHNDEAQGIGVTVPVSLVAEIEKVKLPPPFMPVEMTKYCNLVGHQTLHVKVSGEKQGKVHLFMTNEGFDLRFWQARQGAMHSMPWRLIKPRGDLSVLVLYTEDMNPANVDKLIQAMFYA